MVTSIFLPILSIGCFFDLLFCPIFLCFRVSVRVMLSIKKPDYFPGEWIVLLFSKTDNE